MNLQRSRNSLGRLIARANWAVWRRHAGELGERRAVYADTAKGFSVVIPVSLRSHWLLRRQ